ncbi:iron ABC transporter permease [Neiella sp. HB171785]|uniref:Iron ABC transporter permease n=1 Tax=Neiella litorisoli TaxID=2771431 RepID=A0A8J6ULA6_9GAMM|nr:iron ABC transporter permease [Neiella litorisoli]MBD1388590.1 iron ABC transporter permease [Neiella litorisoli]
MINKCLALVTISLTIIVGAAMVGASPVDLQSALACAMANDHCEANASGWLILSEVRLPRVLMAFVVGGGLALSGSVLQRISRNPLADPYLFGIVAGAGLGAVIGHIVAAWIGLEVAIQLMAFAGALVVTLSVFALMHWQGWQYIERMLLAGVAMSFLCTAITSFLLYLQSPHAANRVLFWLMGSLATADWQAVSLIAPLVLLATLICLAATRLLDAVQLNDDAVHALGIRLQRLRLMLMALVALVTAMIVAFCGGIGFVGLMIPHLVRAMLGNNTMLQILGCVLIGGSYLVLVDAIARTALPYQEVPIGVVTAAIGSIFFIAMMSRGKNG